MNPIYERNTSPHIFDLDFKGEWKPSAFFQYLSEMASLHAEVLGFGYKASLDRNMHWVQSRMKIKFHRFPRYGATLLLRTWPKTIQQKLFFIRDFEVMEEDELIASASSAWLVIDAKERRLIPTTRLNVDIPMLPEKAGLAETLDRLNLDARMEPVFSRKVGYSEVDVVGHANNSRYVEWICNCFPMDWYEEHAIEWMQVNYDHEVRPGEMVNISAGEVNGQECLWYLTGQLAERDERAFEAAICWKLR